MKEEIYKLSKTITLDNDKCLNKSVDFAAILELSLSVLRLNIGMPYDPVILLLNMYLKVFVRAS